jgi:hypothetical protein
MKASVDFLIAGTQKGGTSSLDACLRGHPDIDMALGKEPHFFDNEDLFRAGFPGDAQYHANFPPHVPGRLRGEATPIYMYWREVAARVHRYNPGMKWIILLRNPIGRAYSHWNMERGRKAENLPFLEALRAEGERLRSALPLQHRVFSYVDRGFYGGQLQRIWSLFPRSQTLILRSDVFRRDPKTVLNAVHRFLGVREVPPEREMKENSGVYPAGMGREAWEYLRGVFEPEIRSLESLLGWDCRDWLAPSVSMV